jgi:hypothetical protein
MNRDTHNAEAAPLITVVCSGNFEALQSMLSQENDPAAVIDSTVDDDSTVVVDDSIVDDDDSTVVVDDSTVVVDDSTVNEYGLPLLHLAMVSNCSEDSGPNEENRLQIVRCLLEMGADPNLRDDQGKTPLHHAVSCYPVPNLEVIKMLLEKGASATVPDKEGKMPLSIAHRLAQQQKMAPFSEVFECLFRAASEVISKFDIGYQISEGGSSATLTEGSPYMRRVP